MNPSSPAPARLRDRLREETARVILGAAEEVFASDGLGARMERIAARAGVAVGTLYNHFEDRKALVAALVRSRREALLARLDAALAAARGAPAAQQLRAYLQAVEEHARAHGPLLAVLMQAGEGPGEARPPKTLVDELVRRANAIVARGIAAGELRPDAAKVFGLALVGMSRALLVRAIEGGAEPGGASAAILELFLRGASR
ncbi:MAG TPA: TetR/AcrR family transcriptional regulator [Anaeromyxobacter sp.]